MTSWQKGGGNYTFLVLTCQKLFSCQRIFVQKHHIFAWAKKVFIWREFRDKIAYTPWSPYM